VNNIVFHNYRVNAASAKDMINVCDQIDSELIKMAVGDPKRQNFTIALIEAINNAQEHGYQFNKDKNVIVNLLKTSNSYLLVGIESRGQPIQLRMIKGLLQEDHILKPGTTRGRGFILMKKSVDVLYISHFGVFTEVFLGIYNKN